MSEPGARGDVHGSVAVERLTDRDTPTDREARAEPEIRTEPDALSGRGTLHIRDRAVQRLVQAAAAEVGAVVGPVSRVFGQALGSAHFDKPPQVAVDVAGNLATIELSASVPWPRSVAEVAEELRAHLRRRLAELADLRVGHVDITVTALPRDPRARRRVA